jgi:CRP-like cAMP-binding protein
VQVDADVRAAVSASHLRDLPAQVLDELLTGAVRVRIPAGSVTHWEGEHAPHLELVVLQERGSRPELVAAVTQQELADAVGSVREVVVRVLRDLRQDGIVRTQRDRIVLLDPARLIQEQGWNPGS